MLLFFLCREPDQVCASVLRKIPNPTNKAKLVAANTLDSDYEYVEVAKSTQHNCIS